MSLYLYVLIPVCFLISLFLLFIISKNDFTLLRKNISQNELFNKFFLLTLSALIGGRAFFIIAYHLFDLFHPIRFLHFGLYPGFSTQGASLGILTLIFFLFRDKKVIPRILDIVYLSLFPYFLLSIFYQVNNLLLIKIVLFFLMLGVLITLFILNKNYSVKEGSTFAIILIISSLTFFIFDYYTKSRIIFFISLSQIIGILIIGGSLIYLMINEKLFKT